MNGRSLLCACMVAAAALVGCSNEEKIAYEEFPVRRGDFEVSLREQGVVEARRTVEITATQRARVLDILETGADVKEGDIVVRIDAQDDIDDLKRDMDELNQVKKDLEATIARLQIAMRSNQMDVDAAESQLALRRVELQDIGAQLAQSQALQERELVSSEEVLNQEFQATNQKLSTIDEDFNFRRELAGRELEESTNIIDIERFALRGARARRDILDEIAEIESATIRAPVSGVFLRKSQWDWRQRRNVETVPGDQVREGQILAEIPDLESLIVRSQIPESYVTEVSEGAQVQLTFDGLGGGGATGIVERIARTAIEREASAGGALVDSQSYSGQKVFEVWIDIDELPDGIRPGLTAEVAIVLERKPSVLVAPIEAVERREGRLMVQVRKDGKTSWREVETGVRNDREVVLTSGVQDGEILVREIQEEGKKS